jgi:hypothetical protein
MNNEDLVNKMYDVMFLYYYGIIKFGVYYINSIKFHFILDHK